MQNNIERAKIFMPFDALKGFKEELEKKDELIENKRVLDIDNIEDLNNTLKHITKNLYVKVIYYNINHYIDIIGLVNKVDKLNKTITISNKIIKFDDIIRIKEL